MTVSSWPTFLLRRCLTIWCFLADKSAKFLVFSGQLPPLSQLSLQQYPAAAREAEKQDLTLSDQSIICQIMSVLIKLKLPDFLIDIRADILASRDVKQLSNLLRTTDYS